MTIAQEINHKRKQRREQVTNLKDTFLDEHSQEQGMETVHQICTTAIFGRQEIFTFLYYKPFRERPLPFWLDWVCMYMCVCVCVCVCLTFSCHFCIVILYMYTHTITCSSLTSQLYFLACMHPLSGHREKYEWLARLHSLMH